VGREGEGRWGGKGGKREGRKRLREKGTVRRVL